MPEAPLLAKVSRRTRGTRTGIQPVIDVALNPPLRQYETVKGPLHSEIQVRTEPHAPPRHVSASLAPGIPDVHLLTSNTMKRTRREGEGRGGGEGTGREKGRGRGGTSGKCEKVVSRCAKGAKPHKISANSSS